MPDHLIVHIGWPKTGTTSLQAFCTGNPDWLASQGIAWYATRAGSIGEISRMISKGEDLTEAADRFHAWCQQQSLPVVLISSEGLAANPPALVAAFLRPERWRRITVIAWLRDQADYLEGFYKQQVKWGIKEPLQLAFDHPLAANGRYDELLGIWDDWCAQTGARLIPRLYLPADMAGGDIRQDFFTTLGFDAPADLPPSQNLSPSAALIGLYLKLPPVEKLQQINRKIVASGRPGVIGSGDLFSAEQRGEIRSFYARGNETVRQRYFPQHSCLFPERPASPAADVETGPLQDLLLKTIARMRPEALDACREALLGDAPARA